MVVEATHMAGPGVDHAADGIPFRHPARPYRKRDLRRALHHYRKLVENKEDTSHVFHIYDALPSEHFEPDAERLALTDHGEMLRKTEPYLPHILDDREALRAMPTGSVGQAYCDFMEEQGLTAEGLAKKGTWSGRPIYGDMIEWFGWRQRDTHDLLHVMTGYGRDTLGEACVLLFTHGHSPSPAHLLLGYSGALKIRQSVQTQAPVIEAAREARRAGKGCEGLIGHPIREVLHMDLHHAREVLGFSEPLAYFRCHEIWQDENIDPHRLLSRRA